MILLGPLFLDWQAVAALIGVASVLASAWLQNRREAREEDRRNDRIDDLEARVASLEANLDILRRGA